MSSAVDGLEAAELGCEEVTGLLPLVADGAITAEDDPGLFAHLARCPDCQRELGLHDLATLAIGHGREPAAATAAGAEILRLPWPAVAATTLMAAGLCAAAWIGLRADEHAVAGTQPDEPPPTRVVEVRSDADGNQVIVLMKDGERVEVRRIDQDGGAGGDGEGASTPVSLPRR